MNQLALSDACRATVLQQLQQASNRINAGCQLCKLQQLCNHQPCTPHTKVIAKGETIFQRGDLDGFAYSVREGAVKTTRYLRGDEEQVLGFQFQGELFGLDGLSGEPRNYQAIALEESILCLLPLHLFVTEKPAGQSFSHILHLLSKDAHDFKEHAVMINRSQASTRLAVFLLDLARRTGVNDENDNVSFTLVMSRQDIASYLGLTIETVSRRLCKLEREKAIEMDDQRRNIRLTNLEYLQQLAFF